MRFPSLLSCAALIMAAALSCNLAQAAIKVDGKLDEAEWAQATRFDAFRITEPFILSAPDAGTATVARMIATPQGIAVSFMLEQDTSIKRVKPLLQRDDSTKADRVNFVIDFDGDGLSAYSFTVGLSGSVSDAVITNENSQNPDWDTDWKSAVTESDTGWQVELLIPWTVTTMRNTDKPNRTVGVYFGRLLAGSDVLLASPSITLQRGRFLSMLTQVHIAQYKTALFHYWPYVTANHNFVDNKTRTRAGVDVFWKPNQDFQLSATVNPDFGQVESDALVINFDALETFFSDKRPFFTENQGIFNVNTPNGGRLVHTRRIGGPADDGSGASDIDAAVKLNGSFGRVNVGVLAASESGSAGRTFYIGRLQYPVSPELSVGYLGSLTERPFLERSAMVQAVDVKWKPNEMLAFTGQVLGSSVKTGATRVNGSGAWFKATLAPSANWNHELELTHFDSELNFNDIGYQRRASVNTVAGVSEYVHRFSAPDSVLRSSRWQAQLQGRSNDHGDRLPSTFTLTSYQNLRSGDLAFLQVGLQSEGADDLISRNNGLWIKERRASAEAQFVSRRHGDFSFSAVLSFQPRGLSSDLSRLAGVTLNWFPSNALKVVASFQPEWGDDWLLWEGGRKFGRYARRSDYANLNVSWFPKARHEVRLKAEWVAVRAREGRAYLLQPSGEMLDSNLVRPAFYINNFGLQLRYQYKLAPESDLFVAYSRGGSERLNHMIGTSDLISDALQLRKSDQLFAKLRYRF